MRPRRFLSICLGSILGLICVVLVSLVFGARHVPVSDVIETLFYQLSDTMNNLVVQERVPRTVFGLVAGAALGLSGALMQAITRNPIADPSILGVNTGAALVVVVGIAFFQIQTPEQYIWFALLGATVTAILVYSIGSMGRGGATPIKLALAGAAVSAALSSMVSAVVLPRTEVMNVYRFWQVGSISGATWDGLVSVLPFIIVGVLLGLFAIPGLDALALGEEMAVGLGARTGLIRIMGAVAGVLLCGATTALAGPIGFIGLMVPHVMRLIFGPSLRIIIPMSAVGGAMLLVLSDVIGRLLGSPSELEAGIVTAFLGAPILILIAMRAKVRSL